MHSIVDETKVICKSLFLLYAKEMWVWIEKVHYGINVEQRKQTGINVEHKRYNLALV